MLNPIVDYMISLCLHYIITSIIEAGNDSSEAQEPTMKAEGKTGGQDTRQKLNGNGGYYDMKSRFSR